ncbi:MAG: sulfite exporter TauE/SafE family protein [Clostridia bacterium]|nr:sulfite exporter TauE/SafE family protein [Clostridia bacterium]MDY4083902.1 sulfite exporter TauE/SafE family protein [Eubacteriales bacterium]
MGNLWKSGRISIGKRILIVMASLFAGFATGVFGGGGGMIVVPILTGLYGLEPVKAHATAIATIFPLCLVSVIFYLTQGGWQWKSGLVVTAGVVVGGIVGALLMKKIPAKWLQPIFYILMIVGGVKMALA